MHGSHRQALVSALAEICNLELHTAAGSPGTAGLRSSCESDANSGTGSELAVSAGSACGAAHGELLRLCISALSRAAGPAPSAKPAATGPGASRNAAAAPDGAAAKASAQAAMTVLVAVLEACAGGSARPLADPVASAFYWTLTRALRLLMPEVQLRLLTAHRAPSAVAALALAPASPLHAKSSCHQRWCTMWGVPHTAGADGAACCASGHLPAEVPALWGAAAAPVAWRPQQRPTLWRPDVQTSSEAEAAPGWPGAWRLSASAPARTWL